MDGNVIRINEKTLKETVYNVTPGLPYTSNVVDMHSLPDDTFPWHWHGEVEVFFVVEGTVEYHVPGSMQVFRPGEAGFINANVLHMTHAPDSARSIQVEHIFLPDFISGQPGSDIEMKYVRPVLRGSGLDLFKFEPAEPAVDLMRRAHELYSRSMEGFELQVRSRMSELWMEIFRQTRTYHGADRPWNFDDERVKHMLTYINEHFAEKVTLGNVARAGLVGERECFRIFKRSLGTTPLDCLTRKRLARAGELLKTTSMPLSDIAFATGFCSASYFAKVFREHFGITPREYRKR